MDEGNEQKEIRSPSFLDALIPIVFLVVLLALAIILYGDEGISGPIQVVPCLRVWSSAQVVTTRLKAVSAVILKRPCRSVRRRRREMWICPG